MLAVIQTGGKQYKVSPGDEIQIEKIPGKAGDTVRFDQVLIYEKDDDVKVGTPLVQGVEVTGEIIRQDRSKKIVVFKFKRRKKYRKKQGHRQSYTRLKITDIGKPGKKAAAKKEAEKPVAVNE